MYTATLPAAIIMSGRASILARPGGWVQFRRKVLMDGNRLAGVKGWLLVYLIGSIPLLMVYSSAFSGWFFEYPVVLMAAIFLLLAVPLGLILLKSPKAPQWNIAELWLLVVLMTLRSISVFLMPVSGEEMSSEELISVVLTLSGIVSVSIGWAIVWTSYFKKSVRAKRTFY